MGYMFFFTRKIQIANIALNAHLSDLQTYQDWEQCLKPKRRHSGTIKT